MCGKLKQYQIECDSHGVVVGFWIDSVSVYICPKCADLRKYAPLIQDEWNKLKGDEFMDPYTIDDFLGAGSDG